MKSRRCWDGTLSCGLGFETDQGDWSGVTEKVEMLKEGDN